MMTGKSLRFLLYISLLLLVVAACSNSKGTATNPTDQNETATLEELAKKEGKVVMISTNHKPDMDPVLNLFEEKYGIKVEFATVRGGEQIERLSSERRAGRPTVDIVHNGPTPMWIFKNDGYLAHYPIEGSEELIGTDPDGYFVGGTLVVYGLLVNTDVVPEDKIPQKWEDLLDPYWKGNIYSDDPRIQGGANSVFTMFYDDERFGPEFLEKLADQDLIFTRQSAQYEDAVGRGEVPIFIPGRSSALTRLQGSSVKWIAIDDYTPYLDVPFGVLEEAPHPNAARLFLEFLISEEVQNLIGQHNPPAHPNAKPPLEEMDVSGKVLVTQTEEQLANQPEYTEKITKIFLD